MARQMQKARIVSDTGFLQAVQVRLAEAQLQAIAGFLPGCGI
jgi:hypothetical protein